MSEAALKDTALEINQSININGVAHLAGAKNAVLVIMASLILTSG